MRILAAFVFLGFVQSAFGTVNLDAKQGSTEFLAVGRPSALKINGKGQGPTGNLSFKSDGTNYILNGEAVVDLSSFETGIGMRDRHMKETYLEVEKFKTAKLTLKNIVLSKDKVANGGEINCRGSLDFHGKQQDVDVTMQLEKKSDILAAISKFKIKLSDFGIAVPKYAGITVADEVTVTAETKVAATAVMEGT